MNYKKVGIDIGSFSIRLTTTSDERIEHFKTYARDSDISLERLVSSCLKDFSKEIGSTFFDLHISFPLESDKLFENTEILTVKGKKKQLKGVSFAIQKSIANISTLVDEEYLSAWSYSGIDSEEFKGLYIAHIKESFLNELIKLRGIRCKISCIELQPVTASRIMIGANSALVDLGYQSTRVYFYKQGRLVDYDVIDISAKDVNEILIRNGIDDIEGFYDDNLVYDIDDYDNSVNSEVRAILEEISDNVKKSIRMHEVENEFNFETVSCVGGLSKFKHYKEFLTSELNIEFKPIEIKYFYDDENPKSSNNFVFSSLSTSYRKRDKTLNFMTLKKIAIDYKAFALSALAFTVIFNSGLFMQERNLNKSLEDGQELLNTVNSTGQTLNNELRDIQFEIEEYSEKISLYEFIYNQKEWSSDLLFILPDLVPRNVYLESINYEDDELRLIGLSNSYSNIAYFAKNLESLGVVTINNIANPGAAGQDLTRNADDLEISRDEEYGFNIVVKVNERWLYDE